ncbi:hypothetical protein D3C80_2085870 [compost metagenome]
METGPMVVRSAPISEVRRSLMRAFVMLFQSVGGLSTSLIYRRAVRSMDRRSIRARERFGDRSNTTLMTP